MNHHTPEGLIDRAFDRACEMLALRMVSSGTDAEITDFVDNLHRRLDVSIEKTLVAMEQRIKINEALKNPKIAK